MKAVNFILILLVSLSTFAYPQPMETPGRAADEREIRKAIDEIGQAYVDRNAEPFERIYFENYIYIRNKPVYNMRAQLIAMMKADAGLKRARKKLDYETLSYESENPSIRFFGDTAIVTVSKKNNWRYLDSKCLTRHQATEVWLKRNGKWRLRVGHVSTFHCDPKPWHPIHSAVAAIFPDTRLPMNTNLEAVGEIRTLIDEIAARSGVIDDASGAMTRIFAKDYVATNVNGEVGADRSDLLNALKKGSIRRIGQPRETRAIQVFDDTGIVTFRLDAPDKTKAQPGDSQQFTVVLVKIEGQWSIAASHTSKVAAAE